MSGVAPPTPPPAPLGLPPPRRGIRALNTRPAILAGVVIVGLTGLVLYTISPGNGPQTQADAVSASASQGGGAADILANAPTGNEIVTARQVTSVAMTDPGIRRPATDAPPPPAPPIPDDMTETAIAARKAAWNAYYAAIAERDRTRAENRMKAMQADTAAETPATAPSASTPQPSGGLGPAQQGPKDFFQQAASNPATDYSPFTLTEPISPYELKATDMITARLITQLNSDSPGTMKAIVTKNVLDHATGHHILIPQGATLQGVYDTNVAYGQTRVVTAWTRVIYPPPCDQSLDLGAMAGADQTGQAGFEDLTNNHLGKIFTSAILVSVFGAAAQLSQPSGNAFQSYSPVQTAAGAVGQQTSQLGAEFARKGLSIAPTEQVRAGYSFGIFLVKDIAFAKPWVAGQCGGNAVQVAAP
jgi:type IV secretion system protein VirB10